MSIAEIGPYALSGGGRWQFSGRRLGATLATAALCIAAWAALAPAKVGGSTTYVVTTGVSMLPHFHAGDLVLLRKQSTYHVGDVAGYHNAQLGVTVMHRIVAIEGGHYFFKGDNNDFTDSYHPTAAQIVGAEWIHLPGWGNFLLTLRAPVVAAVVLGVMWLFLFWPRSGSSRRLRRRRNAR